MYNSNLLEIIHLYDLKPKNYLKISIHYRCIFIQLEMKLSFKLIEKKKNGIRL